ncbi:MAG: DUF2235 domain-containing protein [Acidobacteriota bacterium]
MPGPKRIVLCSDGTGNTAGKGRGTNVWKVYEAVDTHGHRDDPGLTEQVAFYDDGVGTEQIKAVKLLTGAFGIGLKRNVLDLYTALCRSYQPGDEIYLFGFSRGAFTVRTLAGLITECGIIDTARYGTDQELKGLVGEAYRSFRKHFPSFWTRCLGGVQGLFIALRRRLGKKARSSANAHPRHAALRLRGKEACDTFRGRCSVVHDRHAPDGKVRIRFIGVWDTVDAIGLPFDDRIGCLNPVTFPSCNLSEQVDVARHALSIDDERQTFHPVMWDETDETSDRIQQVWFAGVHSNVGGGYPKQGMSLVPLDWMMTEAAQAERCPHETGGTDAGESGLRFIPALRASYHERQNVHDKLYDSRSGLACFYRYKPRDIPAICAQHGLQTRIHASVFRRIGLATEGYAPGNLGLPFHVAPDHEQLPRTIADSLEKEAPDMDQAPAKYRAPLLAVASRRIALRRRLHGVFLSMTVILLLHPLVQPLLDRYRIAHPEADVMSVRTWVGMIQAVCDAATDWTAIAAWLWHLLAGMLLAILGALQDPLTTLCSVVRRVCSAPAHVHHLTVWLMPLLIVLYVAGLLARRSMVRTFSRFWRQTLPRPWW